MKRGSKTQPHATAENIQKIVEKLENSGIKKSWLSKKLNMSRGYLYLILENKVPLTVDVKNKIFKILTM